MNKNTGCACPRCGYESRCSGGSWYDRHPTAAVAFATFSLMFSLVVVVGYPWLLLVAAVGAAVYAVDREVRRRRALVARADWEHRQVMAAALREVEPPRPERRRRPRGASHFARTEPMRSAR